MKIALFTDGIFPYVIGGMQKHSYYLAKYFAKKGVQVDLYHTNQSNLAIDKLELFDEDEKKFIHSIVIPFPKLKHFPGHYLKSSYIYSQLMLEEFLKRPDVDFIYAKGFCGWRLIERKVEGKLKIPIGVNFHGFEMFQEQASLRGWIQSRLLLRKPVEYIIKNADCVFSYGGKITEIIEKIGIVKNKIIDIPTGIEESWAVNEIRLSEKMRRFIFIGRYERRKGIEELSNVLKKMSSSFSFKFEFVGDIPENKRIDSPHVQYHGEIRNILKIKELVRSCDVLVCPSYSEGMPNVIMEAMASGLAVIATDVGAVSKMVSKENGFLIQPASEEAIFNAINSCLQCSSEYMDGMKRVSLSKVREKFLWDQVIEETIKKVNQYLLRFNHGK